MGRSTVMIAAAAALALTGIGSALGAPGSLTFLDVVHQAPPDIPLEGAHQPTLSTDGAQLYVPAQLDNAVVTLGLETSGALNFIEADVDGGAVNMLGPLGVAVAPGGDFVYVTGNQSDSVVTFLRDPESGALTHVESLVPGTANLDAPQDIELSPDASKAYVASALNDAVATFGRDPDGSLSFLEQITNGDQGGTVSGLGSTTGIGLSPDGAHVYVTNFDTDSVVTFAREPDSTLDFVEVDADATLLDGPRGVTVSPDGRNVYVGATNGDAVATYSRHPDGSLTFLEVDREGDAGIPENTLRDARDPLVSPDGRLVYVAAQASDAIAIFERDPASGALSFREAARDGVAGIDGIDGVTNLTIDEPARHLYAGAFNEGAVAAFNREPDPLTLELLAKRKQRPKRLRVTAECSADCAIELRAKGKAEGRRFKSRSLAADLGAGVEKRLRLRFKPRARKLLSDARGKARVNAEALDEFGQTAADSVRVKLRP